MLQVFLYIHTYGYTTGPLLVVKANPFLLIDLLKPTVSIPIYLFEVWCCPKPRRINIFEPGG